MATSVGSVKIDGSKVHFFATKKAAQQAARDIGWPVSCVVPVHTRFQAGWALGTGLSTDVVTDLPHLSPKAYEALYRARNQPPVCPGCHAVGREPHASDCPDARVLRAQGYDV